MKKSGTNIIIADHSKDARRKLTEEEKETIKSLQGSIGLSTLARQYGVTRTNIFYIWNPDKLKENREKFKDSGGQVFVKTVSDKHLEKKKLMYEQLANESLFELLSSIKPNQIIHRIVLKNKAQAFQCMVTDNNSETKQIEVFRPNIGNTTIKYSDIKTLIFKSK